MTKQSISFDRIAERYDETRGGLRRGREVAESISPHLTGSGPVLEVGTGTGAVAVALAEMGRDVVGIDLAPEMLRYAQQRLGARVACADAHALPFVDAQFDSAYIVWVLHVVADPTGVLRECARVLRPDGRLVIAAGRPRPHSSEWTEITEILEPLDRFRDDRLNDDSAEGVQAWASSAGLRTVALLEREEHFEETPGIMARTIEERAYSYLWNVDDEAWADVIQPVIDRLRELPDQDRPRPAHQAQPLHVFTR